jgi:periplasmic protein TonB
MKLLLALVLAAFAGVQDSTVYDLGNGVSLPEVVRTVYAQYTSEAMKKRIKGKVALEAVVLSDGKVGDVKVVKSVDKIYGLDDNAVKAMKQWEFKPGTKDGKAVAVRIQVDMAFTMK